MRPSGRGCRKILQRRRRLSHVGDPECFPCESPRDGRVECVPCSPLDPTSFLMLNVWSQGPIPGSTLTPTFSSSGASNLRLLWTTKNHVRTSSTFSRGDTGRRHVPTCSRGSRGSVPASSRVTTVVWRRSVPRTGRRPQDRVPTPRRHDPVRTPFPKGM